MSSIIQQTKKSITFQADDVALAKEVLPEWKTYESIIKLIEGHQWFGKKFSGKLESCCDYTDDIVQQEGIHPCCGPCI